MIRNTNIGRLLHEITFFMGDAKSIFLRHFGVWPKIDALNIILVKL